MSGSECAFCAQINGRTSDNELLRVLGTDWARRPLLAELGDAVTMPSIGALTTGHVLVCPRTHVCSTAGAEAEVAGDVARLAVRVRAFLELRFGEIVHEFEHGSPSDGSRVACSIEHAHVHLVPAAVDPMPALSGLATWRPGPHDPADLAACVQGREYISYREPGGRRWVATTETGFRSQLMRIALAAPMGVVDWNWREAPAVDHVAATVQLFAAERAAA
jgi:ATP adenylyltransferase